MQRLLLFFGLGMATILTACHSKKVIVFANSDIQVDNTGKGITLSDGSGQQEKELDLGGGTTDLTVQSPSGKYTLEATEDGLYIANLKNDTVVGSFQHIGEASADQTITQDHLKKMIDSLSGLLHGQTIPGKNYFIPPGKMVRITGETKAKVFGPFIKIPNDFDAQSYPEVYKFYTTGEARENLAKMIKLTVTPATDEKK